jgi:hypothetical protein
MRQGHGRNGLRGWQMGTGSTGFGNEAGGAAETIRSKDVGREVELLYAVRMFLAGAERDIAQGKGQVDELRSAETEVAAAFREAIVKAEGRSGAAVGRWGSVLTRREQDVILGRRANIDSDRGVRACGWALVLESCL